MRTHHTRRTRKDYLEAGEDALVAGLLEQLDAQLAWGHELGRLPQPVLLNNLRVLRQKGAVPVCRIETPW